MLRVSFFIHVKKLQNFNLNEEYVEKMKLSVPHFWHNCHLKITLRLLKPLTGHLLCWSDSKQSRDVRPSTQLSTDQSCMSYFLSTLNRQKTSILSLSKQTRDVCLIFQWPTTDQRCLSHLSMTHNRPGVHLISHKLSTGLRCLSCCSVTHNRAEVSVLSFNESQQTRDVHLISHQLSTD